MSERVFPELSAATPNWDSMTRQQRGVAVAQDVILLLRSKRLTAVSGLFLKADAPEDCTEDSDLRSVLLQSSVCNVCAIGATFVAKVTARNGVTVGQQCKAVDGELTSWNREGLIYELDDCFPHETMLRIERAFERGWKNQYAADDERLEAIMSVVVKQNGEFSVADQDRYGECGYYDEDTEEWDDDDDDDYYEDDEDEDEDW